MALKVALAGAVICMLLGSTDVLAREEDMGGADLTGQGSTEGDPEPGVEAVTSPAPPAPEVANPTVGSPAQVWDRLAACESSGNWHIDGRTYSGGLQFDAPTWRAYGGLAYASRAAGATRTQQIAVAERLRAARGYQPWPVCSRVVGLR